MRMRWPTDRNGDPAVIKFWESRTSTYHGWDIIVADNPRGLGRLVEGIRLPEPMEYKYVIDWSPGDLYSVDGYGRRGIGSDLRFIIGVDNLHRDDAMARAIVHWNLWTADPAEVDVFYDEVMDRGSADRGPFKASIDDRVLRLYGLTAAWTAPRLPDIDVDDIVICDASAEDLRAKIRSLAAEASAELFS